MVNGIYYRMIRNFQYYGGYQYPQYIHDLLMDQDLELTDNIMPNMTGKISERINISNGYPVTTTLNEAIKGTYTAEFMQATTQDIK